MLFWSSPWISRALWMNKSLLGEICTFPKHKLSLLALGIAMEIGVVNKAEQYEIHIIPDFGYLCTKYGLG